MGFGTGLKNSCLGGARHSHIQGCGNRKRAALGTGGSLFLVSHTWLRKTASLRLKLGFRAKKSKHVGAQVFPRFSKAQRDKRGGAGRGLCVVSFVSGPRAPEGSGFGLGYGFVLGEEKPPWPRASQGASQCTKQQLQPCCTSTGTPKPVPVPPTCSQKG